MRAQASSVEVLFPGAELGIMQVSTKQSNKMLHAEGVIRPPQNTMPRAMSSTIKSDRHTGKYSER
jgi:hypothetical protein